MSRLRLPINILAVLAIAVALTRMMQNPTMWGLLGRPVLGLAGSLNMHGHENVEDLFVYVTMALAFPLAIMLVAVANKMIVRRSHR